MKIKWLGHSSFLITSEKGTKLLTDPYSSGWGITYSPIKEQADVVTVSHEHGDHNNTASLPGAPQVVKGSVSKEVKGISITGIPTYHDKSKGSERGANTIFCLAIDGIKLCHMGDLGHTLTPEEARQIGQVDILLIPVGGYFTIDASEATKVYSDLKPCIVIPMHYKTSKCDMPISGVEDFLRGKTNVKRTGTSEVEVHKDKLPATTEILVLNHAL